MASSSSRPASGPSAIATATARFSSTTGEGTSSARRPYRSAICSQSVSGSKWSDAIAACSWYGPGSRRTSARSSASRPCSTSSHVPELAILVVEQHELAGRRKPRVAARVLQEEERVEAVRLRLVGHQRREHRREADRFGAQLAAHRRPVAGVEDEVDRREDGAQPIGKKVLRRHAQRDAGVADLPLRAHEPLRERRLRNEEAARDLRRREAADEAQRQRDLRVGGERRMAAREDQLEAFVGDEGLLVVGELLGAGEQLRLAREASARDGCGRSRGCAPSRRSTRRDSPARRLAASARPRGGTRPVPRPRRGRDRRGRGRGSRRTSRVRRGRRG